MASASVRTVVFTDVNSPFGIPHFFECLEAPDSDVVALVVAPADARDWFGAMPVPDRWGRGAQRDMLASAAASGIEVLRPETLNSPDFLARLTALKPALCVSAGFRRILPEAVLGAARLATVNFHPSLLPRGRGSNPLFWTIATGEPLAGVTAHHMTRRLDAGDIILQTPIAMSPDETLSTLQHKAIVESLHLVRPLITGLIGGTLPRVPQNEAAASTFRLNTPEDSRIDWGRPARDICNVIRASLSAPGACAVVGDAQVRIMKAEIGTDPLLLERAAAPGTILKATEAGVAVRTGDGHVVLRALERVA